MWPRHCDEWGYHPVSSPYTEASALGAHYVAQWWVMGHAVESGQSMPMVCPTWRFNGAERLAGG